MRVVVFSLLAFGLFGLAACGDKEKPAPKAQGLQITGEGGSIKIGEQGIQIEGKDGKVEIGGPGGVKIEGSEGKIEITGEKGKVTVEATGTADEGDEAVEVDADTE